MYRFQLPEDFLIGTANSAFQSEGAWDRDGKSESIMDHFARKYAGKLSPAEQRKLDAGRSPDQVRPNSLEMPDRGCFFYDNYEAYIEDMQKTGQNTYRMSLSWPRILPDGVGAVNQLAIDHYNRVIDKLLSCGITPFVDLYHWDLPICLFEQGGFLNPEFPAWFENYARVCFTAFGDRVKLWSTFNETQISLNGGFDSGGFPPFRQNKREALLGGHHVLLAHFRAVRLYRSIQLGGKIGAVNCLTAITPARICAEDIKAVDIQWEHTFGWWTQPMLEGRYPQSLIDELPFIRDNLPAHYQEDLDRWFAPMDFIGVNYYIATRTQFCETMPLHSRPVQSFYSAPGQRFAPYPAGLFDAVMSIAERYPGVEIYITENGCALQNRHDAETECDDPERITYLREHLRMVCRCLQAGAKLKGYYYWNDADSYEELDGYNLRFGLTWVDHETGERRWKNSRYYFSQICRNRMVD